MLKVTESCSSAAKKMSTHCSCDTDKADGNSRNNTDPVSHLETESGFPDVNDDKYDVNAECK